MEYGAFKNAEVTVYNVLGVAVYKSPTINVSTYQIDISSHPKGVYFVKVMCEGETVIGNGKLVIQ
ncbi:MAG: hypothetical protein COA57_16295 [Flavobacteriales bacterium]|nr:MAG: hypothetical protein COA57_16295 [Flavobacteriales bacterium]